MFDSSRRPIKLHGLTWIRTANGKLVDGWQHSDIPAVVWSLGEAG